jgi:(p)ppGpp synthase/HD superfamily hydrolase
MIRFLKAIQLASEAHKDQKRKTSNLPYIEHPLAVGLILKEMNCSEDTIIAGILHDTLEDTDLQIEIIQKEFGKIVVSYLEYVTESKHLNWEERKTKSIEKIKLAPLEVKYITAADKFHNLYTLQEEFNSKGEMIWDSFLRKKPKQEWYYRSMFDSIIYNWEEKNDNLLIQNLEKSINSLFG